VSLCVCVCVCVRERDSLMTTVKKDYNKKEA
jgi:hypothetical protein